ncbi:MAG TPA: hypothetical protein VNU26_04285 [Mycobacteriales bacterium]|nr:hypothetical protein [Mycobacteriales bacterium]
MTAVRAVRCAGALLVAALVALGLAWTATPAAAARTVDVVLSASAPAAVSLAPGDSVRFVNGETGPLAPPHRVTATQRGGSTSWQYESDLLAGGQSTEPVVFRSAGTYLFIDRRGGPGPLGTEQLGRIVVSAPRTSTDPAPQPAPAAPAPAPPAQPAPAPAPAPETARTPAPSTAVAAPAPLDVPLPAPTDDGPAFPQHESGAVDDAADGPPPVQALRGPLPGALTSRGFGLPASLAAVAALGVASLLVRVLLAEPAARGVLRAAPAD